MEENEPRPRRRGFFHHSETGEPDSGEHENPEGFMVRVRFRRSFASRVNRAARHSMLSGGSLGGTRSEALSGSRYSGGRQSRAEAPAVVIEHGRLRSESATGTRQRAHLTR